MTNKQSESHAVLALREYLRTTPREELDAITVQVNSLNIQGPTLKEVLDLSPVWQLHLAEQQLEVARKALHAIGDCPPEVRAEVKRHFSSEGMWRACIATATKAIQDMRNLKRK